MSKKWGLGNLFRKGLENERSPEDPFDETDDEKSAEAKETASDEPLRDTVALPEVKGALLQVWEKWKFSPIPPVLFLTGERGAKALKLDVDMLERERLRLLVQLEQDAKKRIREIETEEKKENTSLNSKCCVYLSKDKMVAWAFFFPPVGPEGTVEAGALGRALESAGVTTGIESAEVVRLLQKPVFFELIPIAIGTAPEEGTNGQIVEHYERELALEVAVDERGVADYRTMNYVRSITEGDVICDIIPPQEGTPGVQVDGKPIKAKPVRAARPPKGTNTEISEDGLHLVASKTGHLEFSRDAFHVRTLLEVRSDVDYSTGNLNFDGDIHITGDVREGFEVRATGSVMVDGLVEAATVEAGGDLVISCGVVGDHRAWLRSKGSVRAKFLENCVVYAGKTVYADCIMTSQIFSDDAISVTSGRGSVIGGTLTAANLIRARVIGAQSGRRTELELGTLPCVRMELDELEEELAQVQEELKKVAQELTCLERTEGQEGSTPSMARARLRKYSLEMKEKSLTERREELSPDVSDLIQCRLECDTIYPVTGLTMQGHIWTAETVSHFCRIGYNADEGELKLSFGGRGTE